MGRSKKGGDSEGSGVSVWTRGLRYQLRSCPGTDGDDKWMRPPISGGPGPGLPVTCSTRHTYREVDRSAVCRSEGARTGSSHGHPSVRSLLGLTGFRNSPGPVPASACSQSSLLYSLLNAGHLLWSLGLFSGHWAFVGDGLTACDVL